MTKDKTPCEDCLFLTIEDDDYLGIRVYCGCPDPSTTDDDNDACPDFRRRH